MRINGLVIFLILVCCRVGCSDGPRVGVLAGGGRSALSDGRGGDAAFREPFGICLGAEGVLYVADSANHCIRKVTAVGVVTTFAGNGEKATVDGAKEVARFNTPSAVRADGKGNLYVCSYEENSIRIIDAQGNVRSLVASREEGYRDGSVAIARILAPRGMVFDSKGSLIFSDCWNHRIRKISPSGIVSTLAGGGPTGVEAAATCRDGKGNAARFYAPCGIAIDRDDNLFVADAENHRIRRVTPDGTVTTIAGHGVSGKAGRGFADGPTAKSRLNTPTDVAVGSDGSIYFSDTYGNRIRRVSLQGVVETIAGSGTAGKRNGSVGEAEFDFPRGIVLSGRTILVSDFNNHSIRKIELK